MITLQILNMNALFGTLAVQEINITFYASLIHGLFAHILLRLNKIKVIITLKGANDDFTAYNFKVTSDTFKSNTFIGHTDYNWDLHLQDTETPAILKNFVVHKKCKFLIRHHQYDLHEPCKLYN